MLSQQVLFKYLRDFLYLFLELFILFVFISFIVSILQIYISRERITNILNKGSKLQCSIFGSLLGALTPFCSCSTIPILIGLFKSGAPFCGAISFLFTSPILNPAIIILMYKFFSIKTTIVYVILTFMFCVVIGLILDRLGFSKYVKNVTINYEEKNSNILLDNFLQVLKFAFKDSFLLLKNVLPFLILGAGIGTFIHGFVPENLLNKLFGSGVNRYISLPIAAIIGIPMYIRFETMIPIASALIYKGLSKGITISLILGGAGCSIPEIFLLSSIFKKPMTISFLFCIFAMSVIIGFLFTFFNI